MTDAEGCKQSVIEHEALDRLHRFGGDKLQQAMIEMFLDLTPDRIGELHSSLNANDMKAFSLVAHSITSSAAQIGAMGMRPLGNKLETLSRDGVIEQLPELLGRLEQEFAAAKDRLETMYRTDV